MIGKNSIEVNGIKNKKFKENKMRNSIEVNSIEVVVRLIDSAKVGELFIEDNFITIPRHSNSLFFDNGSCSIASDMELYCHIDRDSLAGFMTLLSDTHEDFENLKYQFHIYSSKCDTIADWRNTLTMSSLYDSEYDLTAMVEVLHKYDKLNGILDYIRSELSIVDTLDIVEVLNKYDIDFTSNFNMVVSKGEAYSDYYKVYYLERDFTEGVADYIHSLLWDRPLCLELDLKYNGKIVYQSKCDSNDSLSGYDYHFFGDEEVAIKDRFIYAINELDIGGIFNLEGKGDIALFRERLMIDVRAYKLTVEGGE